LRILLTGATGFIGNRLLEYLSSVGGNEVYCIARTAVQTGEGSVVTWLQQDLSRRLDISILPAKLDAIIHLAQSKNYRSFPEQAMDIFDVNVASTLRLLDYGRRAGIKSFVFASTGGVSGYKGVPIIEDHVPNPPSFYVNSKYVAECLVKAYSAYFNTVALRYFFVYGENQRDMLIPNLISSIMAERSVLIHNEYGRKLNPIYVDDAVKATEAALSIEGVETINVAGAEIVTFLELAKLIGQVLNKTPIFDFTTENAPIDIVADTTKMRAKLGVVPEVTLKDGLTKVVKAFKRDY
jgi:UDP-glucose 4-epimerase